MARSVASGVSAVYTKPAQAPPICADILGATCTGRTRDFALINWVATLEVPKAEFEASGSGGRRGGLEEVCKGD